MKFTALLPLKAHSERVPNKNIKSFAGKPLYQHVCQILENSTFIAEILINTDSEHIAQESTTLFKKVKVVKRPLELCGDYVSMNKIIHHDTHIAHHDNLIQTHSTNPLLTLETLNKALTFYMNNFEIHDSVFSVTKMQTRFYFPDMTPVNHSPGELIRTQDLKPLFEENSNFYIFSKNSFLKHHNRIGETPYMFEMPKLEAIDIDDHEDFTLAEMIYQTKRGSTLSDP